MAQENFSYRSRPEEEPRGNSVTRKGRGVPGDRNEKTGCSVPAPDFDPRVSSYVLAA